MVSVAEGKYNRYLGAIGLAVLLIVGLLYVERSGSVLDPEKPLCRQSPARAPEYSTLANSSQFLTESYKKKSVKYLAGAIRIPTMSYDDLDMDPTKDPRFDVFADLHKYLFKTFPLSAKYVETVNTYGLLYTIPGTEPSLKPVVLMAHQDVVPVNPDTLDKWTYPPFDAHFDGERLYGRGTSDTKNSLVGQLEAVESLLQQGWVPKRTVVLSYGFDEEVSGYRGAYSLSREILKRYGHNGVEAIVDEGLGLMPVGQTLFAIPAVTEKGRIDYKIVLNTPGGHSSMPPDHTGIGIMSELVTELEANPLVPEIAKGGVIEKFYNCLGERAEGIDESLRKKFINSGGSDKLFPYIDANPFTRFSIRTSQAVDIVQGGVKINALPEQVELQVDHRIAIHQNIADLDDRLLKYIKKVAEKYNVGVNFEGETLVAATANGGFSVSKTGGIEPAPVSPFEGEVWDVLMGTTKYVLDEVFEHPYGPLVAAPSVMTANTDTAHYWDVSENIFRYQPLLLDDAGNIHTVDENIRMRSHYLGVVWYYDFLINVAN